MLWNQQLFNATVSRQHMEAVPYKDIPTEIPELCLPGLQGKAANRMINNRSVEKCHRGTRRIHCLDFCHVRCVPTGYQQNQLLYPTSNPAYAAQSAAAGEQLMMEDRSNLCLIWPLKKPCCYARWHSSVNGRQCRHMLDACARHGKITIISRPLCDHRLQFIEARFYASIQQRLLRSGVLLIFVDV